jgi:hypothetical protein
LCTVLVARVDFVKPLPIGQCVAVQVDGQVTLTLNVTNVGFYIVIDVRRGPYLLLSFSR